MCLYWRGIGLHSGEPNYRRTGFAFRNLSARSSPVARSRYGHPFWRLQHLPVSPFCGLRDNMREKAKARNANRTTVWLCLHAAIAVITVES